MKLYDSPHAPNPRRVRIFLAEKGVSVPRVFIDLAANRHKEPAYSAINPLHRIPALELDDGTIITESIAICRYMEALHPAPPLFGVGALDAAFVEMWQRQIEMGLLLHVAAAFRHSHPAMAALEVPQIAELAATSKPKALEFLEVLDRHLSDKAFLTGAAFTIADITGLVTMDFMKLARIDLPPALANVRRWHSDLAARPSAKA